MQLERVRPESAGVLSERLSIADLMIEDAVKNKVIPGAVTLVTSKGYIVWHKAFGSLDPEENRAVKLDSIYDLASMTKPVATGVGMVALVEDGRVHLEREVGEFFPNRNLPQWNGITLRNLLTHTSGLPAWQDFYSEGQTRNDILDSILNLEHSNPPGTVYEYSCLGYILLCFILEKIVEMPLDQYLKARIYKPLEMLHTAFNPPAEWRDNIAATAHCPKREQKLVGVVHDGNAFGMRGISGNAGLFSNAEDLATFWNMLLYKGAFLGKRVLSPLAAKLMITPQIDPSIGGESIGCFTGTNGILGRGDLFPLESFGHTGFTGTAALVDPIHEVVSILLTNRVYWENDLFFPMRRHYQNAVASAIIE